MGLRQQGGEGGWGAKTKEEATCEKKEAEGKNVPVISWIKLALFILTDRQRPRMFCPLRVFSSM